MNEVRLLEVGDILYKNGAKYIISRVTTKQAIAENGAKFERQSLLSGNYREIGATNFMPAQLETPQLKSKHEYRERYFSALSDLQNLLGTSYISKSKLYTSDQLERIIQILNEPK